MSEQEVVSLSSLMTPSKTVQIDFPGYEGFRVLVCYLAREELVKLRKKCITTKFNKRTHQPEEELNEDKFLVEYSKAVIRTIILETKGGNISAAILLMDRAIPARKSVEHYGAHDSGGILINIKVLDDVSLDDGTTVNADFKEIDDGVQDEH